VRRPIRDGGSRREPRAGAETAVLAAIAVAAVATMLWAWYWNVRENDFGTEAARSFGALLHGHLLTFLQTAPAYGGSLLLRAPFALPASLAGSGMLTLYRLSALPCLLVLAALGVWLARVLRARGGSLIAAAGVVAVCVANPITYRALQLGHPEELLGATLCTVAVLLAQRGRLNWAGLALGLAIANKQWALLAIGPVLLAAPDGRWRILLLASASAAALLAPIALAAGSLESGTSRLADPASGFIFHPQQVFWFLGHRDPGMPSSIRLPPGWLSDRVHLIIVALGIPLSWLAWRRRTTRADALLLLALLLLLRCWLDPWDVIYYVAPFVVALLAWETTVARPRPLYSVTATAATWLVFWYLPRHVGSDAQSLAFLVPSTLAIALMVARVYGLAPRRSPAVLRTTRPRLTRVPVAPS
jgi:Glycosyltransferase family 87